MSTIRRDRVLLHSNVASISLDIAVHLRMSSFTNLNTLSIYYKVTLGSMDDILGCFHGSLSSLNLNSFHFRCSSVMSTRGRRILHPMLEVDTLFSTLNQNRHLQHVTFSTINPAGQFNPAVNFELVSVKLEDFTCGSNILVSLNIECIYMLVDDGCTYHLSDKLQSSCVGE